MGKTIKRANDGTETIDHSWTLNAYRGGGTVAVRQAISSSSSPCTINNYKSSVIAVISGGLLLTSSSQIPFYIFFSTPSFLIWRNYVFFSEVNFVRNGKHGCCARGRKWGCIFNPGACIVIILGKLPRPEHVWESAAYFFRNIFFFFPFPKRDRKLEIDFPWAFVLRYPFLNGLRASPELVCVWKWPGASAANLLLS